MIVVVLAGDPETISAALTALIALGKNIIILSKCRNDSKYIVAYV